MMMVEGQDLDAPEPIKRDAIWASQYEREVLGQALGELAVTASNLDQDVNQATDFITSTSEHRWGSRMRRQGWRDVTVRVWRKDARRTEVDKLGHLTRYLNAWLDDEGQVRRWVVWNPQRVIHAGLLDRGEPRFVEGKFRQAFKFNLRTFANLDQTTAFVAIPIDYLQDVGALVAGRRNPKAAISHRYAGTETDPGRYHPRDGYWLDLDEEGLRKYGLER